MQSSEEGGVACHFGECRRPTAVIAFINWRVYARYCCVGGSGCRARCVLKASWRILSGLIPKRSITSDTSLVYPVVESKHTDAREPRSGASLPAVHVAVPIRPTSSSKVSCAGQNEEQQEGGSLAPVCLFPFSTMGCACAGGGWCMTMSASTCPRFATTRRCLFSLWWHFVGRKLAFFVFMFAVRWSLPSRSFPALSSHQPRPCHLAPPCPSRPDSAACPRSLAPLLAFGGRRID